MARPVLKGAVGLRHGSVSRYEAGCRCERCAAAYAVWWAQEQHYREVERQARPRIRRLLAEGEPILARVEALTAALRTANGGHR